MGFLFGGTQANVTIEGGIATTLPTYASDQTFKSASIKATAINAGASNTLYSVTAGKTFYLTSINMNQTSAGNVQLGINDNSATDLYIDEFLGSATDTTIHRQTFPSPIPFTTAVRVTNRSGNNATSTISIQGFEV